MRYSRRSSLFLCSWAPHGPWPLSAVDDAPRRDFVSAAALKYGRDDAYARTHKYTVKLPFNGHGGEGVKDEFPGTRPGSRSASALSAAGRRLLVCYWTLAAFLALDQHCQHALQPAADTSHDAKTSPSLRSAASRASVRRTSST